MLWSTFLPLEIFVYWSQSFLSIQDAKMSHTGRNLNSWSSHIGGVRLQASKGFLKSRELRTPTSIHPILPLHQGSWSSPFCITSQVMAWRDHLSQWLRAKAWTGQRRGQTRFQTSTPRGTRFDWLSRWECVFPRHLWVCSWVLVFSQQLLFSRELWFTARPGE